MSIERIYITAGPYQEIISGIQMILSFSDGVVKLTGQEGAGKTSLLQKLQAHIEAEGQQTLLFSPPPKSVLELHNTVTRTYALGADLSFRKALARHLGNQPRDKQNLIMLFDDADTMDDETLCDLLLFRNVKQGDQALVSIVLFGSSNLDQRLSAPELADLVRDIVLNYELNPLDASQLAAFCKEAIPALGLRISLPSAQRLEQLLQETRGLPGVVLERLPALAADAGESSAEATDSREVLPAEVEPEAASPVAVDVAEEDAGPAPVVLAIDEAPLALAIDEGDDDDASPGYRKALMGGLALAASVAAAWFFFPQISGLLRSSESTVVATPVVPPAPTVVEEPVAPATPAEPEPIQSTPVVAEAPEAVPEAIAEAEAAPDTSNAADEIADSEAATAAPQVATAEVATETVAEPDIPTPDSSASLVPTFPAVDAVEASEANLLALVRSWLDAWQNQDLDAYFASYHTDFAPLYQSTRSAWRDNRVRSIQRPSAISIGLEDFSVAGSTDVGMQVSFWMEYQSPGYADRTFKELVIGNDIDGSLRILQEANRQVLALAPGEISRSPAAPPAVASGSAGATTAIGSPVQLGSVYSQAAAPRTAAGVSTTLAEEVNAFLGTWLDAWQRQDVEDYFAHYHPEFTSSAHASRAAWQDDRREKVSRPLVIQIHLLGLEVATAQDGRSEVNLEMEYHSTWYADRTVKDITLARTANGSWGILSERNQEVTPLPLARLVPDRSITMRVGPGSVYEFAL